MKLIVAVATLAACATAPAAAQNIEITHINARRTVVGTADTFTGAAIADIVIPAGERSPLTAVQVTFEPGARSAWHDHPAGQYLVITSGVGWVQARGGVKREVRAGDVVWTPPGVQHWHGASATQAVTQMAIFEVVDGSPGVMMDLVSDEDYLSDLAAE